MLCNCVKIYYNWILRQGNINHKMENGKKMLWS
jgi:hypothetical protein